MWGLRVVSGGVVASPHTVRKCCYNNEQKSCLQHRQWGTRLEVGCFLPGASVPMLLWKLFQSFWGNLLFMPVRLATCIATEMRLPQKVLRYFFVFCFFLSFSVLFKDECLLCTFEAPHKLNFLGFEKLPHIFDFWPF